MSGSTARVAKVDTEYVYEGNVLKYVEDYRQSRRIRTSTFIGFSPDEILRARESAIDAEIRSEIKRLPAVEISRQEVIELADKRVEELAWELYRRLDEEGADFAGLARQYSVDPSARQGGDLPPFGELPNPEEYQRRAYSLMVGEISRPISSFDGWRIIRLNDITEDPFSGALFHVSVIKLQPDTESAEAEIVDEIAKEHTIEVLDPKYKSRRALERGDFEVALQAADEAISRDKTDDLAHYLRARALWRLGRTDEALEGLHLAAENGVVSEALIPYYHTHLGEYLEELGRNEEALEAFRTSYDSWHQDINMAFLLKAAFERLGDQEYVAMLEEEIDAIARQDSVALTFGRRSVGSGGVIVTGEGETKGSSQEYVPGFQE